MKLSPNFSRAELGNPPAEHLTNAKRLALMLEHVRALCGGRPVEITSGWRLPRKPDDHSQHLTGSAADFAIEGVSCVVIGHRVMEARARGEFPVFGQMIVYPYERYHVHLSLPNRHSGKTDELLVCVKKSPERYQPWDGWGPLPRNEN